MHGRGEPVCSEGPQQGTKVIERGYTRCLFGRFDHV
jgi:hypothetical protein